MQQSEVGADSANQTENDDADHAGNKVNQKSQTRVLIFLNRAPIHWFSKRQNLVETSTFGSEFCALKTGIEVVEGLRYKTAGMLSLPSKLQPD